MADPFNPVDSAALVTKSLPLKKQVQPDALAALPPLLKDRPIILPPKKPKVTLEQGKIDPDAEWFKKHPLQTEHADGTVRTWGEDTLAKKNPYVLPKQMLPPVPEPKGGSSKNLSDKAKGYSNYYYTPNH